MLGHPANVPASGRTGIETGKRAWRQLPMVITIALVFTACDGLETAWQPLFVQGKSRVWSVGADQLQSEEVEIGVPDGAT
jgi:hypothetical protein